MEKYTFKTKPDAYQLTALRKAIEYRKFGIFFQQRVGKTKVAIDFCGMTLQKNQQNKVLIICPLSVRSEWVTQLEEHYPFYYKVFLYPKLPDKRKSLLSAIENENNPVFLIVNYDIIKNDLNYLKKWKANTIIFDESHLIGHYNSARSKAAASLAKNTENVLLLTGTPIPKKWYQIFGQFRAMNNQIFGTSFARFINQWGIRGGYLGKEIVGCKDYETLSKIIAEHSIRVLRRDVFEEVETENIIVPVEFSASSRKLYNELRKKFIIELNEAKTVTADLAITRMIRLQQLCGGFITTDDKSVEVVSTDKLNMTKDLVRTRLEGNEQLVIFYRYTSEGKMLYNELQKLTTKPIGTINGSVSESLRKVYRDSFQAGESEIILIQIATGAMGVSLDRAHINIFYSLDFSLSNFQQARDRVMGRNQKFNVTNYFMAINETIDYKIMKTLQNDEDIASKISNNWRWMMEE